MARQSKKGMITAIIGNQAYLLELKQLPVNTFDPDKELLCPCCGLKLRVVSELGQIGKFEDKWTLLLACIPCVRAYLTNYIISRIEVSNEIAE